MRNFLFTLAGVFALGVAVFAFVYFTHPAPTTDIAAEVDPAYASQAQSLAQDYVDAAISAESNQKEQKILETRYFTKGAAPAAVRQKGVTEMLQELNRMSAGSLTSLREKLGQSEETAKEEFDDARSRWVKIRTERNLQDQLASDAAAKRESSQRTATLFSIDNSWLWLTGLLAAVVIVTVSSHERRHEIRRWLYGASARQMGAAVWLRYSLIGIVVLAVLSSLFAGPIYSFLAPGDLPPDARTFASAAKEIEQAKEAGSASDNLARDARLAYNSDLDQWLRESKRPTDLKELDERLRGLELFAHRISFIGKKIEEDAKAIKTTREHSHKIAQQIAASERTKRGISLVIGLLLFASIGGGAWLFIQGASARQSEIWGTCPKCLTKGGLQEETTLSLRGRKQSGKVRCFAKDPTAQGSVECGYTFQSQYRGLPRLCFPTLGMVGSGKTHWLGMVYYQLGQQGRMAQQLRIDKVSSQASAQFDKVVDRVIEKRIGTEGTQTSELPEPLSFSVRDNDPLGKTSSLVTIFDYSGEVTTNARYQANDPMRQRALDADGFLYFLDPNKRGEPQAEALHRFRQDMEATRGLKPGASIAAPIALCVSKIDMLYERARTDLAWRSVVGQFVDELREIDPSGEDHELETIQARSNAVRRIREILWPGWDVEALVSSLFDGRVEFFPMTPVSLEPNASSDQDFSDRSVDPFCIIDPIVWLVEMNGHPVISRTSAS